MNFILIEIEIDWTCWKYCKFDWYPSALRLNSDRLVLEQLTRLTQATQSMQYSVCFLYSLFPLFFFFNVLICIFFPCWHCVPAVEPEHFSFFLSFFLPLNIWGGVEMHPACQLHAHCRNRWGNNECIPEVSWRCKLDPAVFHERRVGEF